MPRFIKNAIKKTVDVTTPDRKELVHKGHKRRDYLMLLFRNMLVVLASVLFILAFFFDDVYHLIKGVAYFFGAAAYVFECLLLTDCFKTKVPHKEMFMVYCLGPLYLIMGLGYILK